MKILHVIPVYEPAWQAGGGVVRAVSQLCRGLSSLGIEVTVYTTDCGIEGSFDIPLNQAVNVAGVRVFYFHSEKFRFFRYSKTLKQACRRTIGDFDIVDLASFWNYPGIPAGAEVRRQGVPYVISTHGTLAWYDLNRHPLRKRLYLSLVERRNLQQATAIHYTTQIEKEEIAWRLNSPSFVVPNGLDFTEFDDLPSKNDARLQLGIPTDSIVITFLGRLHPRKALDVFIPAFAEVAKLYLHIFFLLAGQDDGHERFLRSLVNSLGLSRRVRFLGFVNSDKRKLLLSATDVLELVTWMGENFGYAAVEAMAAGVPVLMSEHVGICREVEADGAGCVVPVQKDAITAKLKDMLSNPERLKRMGKAAHASSRRRYDIKRAAKLMVTAYEDILTGGHSPELRWAEGKT